MEQCSRLPVAAALSASLPTGGGGAVVISVPCEVVLPNWEDVPVFWLYAEFVATMNTNKSDSLQRRNFDFMMFPR
jgi:hypothetical protein